MLPEEQILKKEKLGWIPQPRLTLGISASTVLRRSRSLQPICSGKYCFIKKEGDGPVRSSQCFQGSQTHDVCQNRPERCGHQAEVIGALGKPTGNKVIIILTEAWKPRINKHPVSSACHITGLLPGYAEGVQSPPLPCHLSELPPALNSRHRPCPPRASP